MMSISLGFFEMSFKKDAKRMRGGIMQTIQFVSIKV